jgi:hypothetical protein
MATVRFSKELQEEIIKKAKAVFDKQLETAKNSRPSHEWGDKIYTTLFGQHVPALNAVPQEFLRMRNNIEVANVGSQQCKLTFNLTSPRPWPNEFKESDLAKRYSHYGDEISLKDDLVWGELFSEVSAWQQRIKDVLTKQNEFVEQVRKIIEAHATLAPALKMWQPLWDLIPEEYKERHRKVVEREKKETVVDVDLSSMTAAVVAHKITR